ncbi:MAG: ChaB family protein [Elainellaceae cyanobacterium]
MAYEQLENLPQDVKEKLPNEGQQIFMTAYNSAESNGMSSEKAAQIAWDTIKNDYEQGDDGTWHRRPECGADQSPIGSMSNS